MFFNQDTAPSITKLVVRIALGLFALLAGIALLGAVFRNQLEAMGHAFVERFGLGGMVLGTWIADGFHFPVPPQFYMLMGVSSGVSGLSTLAAVNLGSFLGGWSAYLLARKLSHFGPLARRLEHPRRLTNSVFTRYGNWAVVVASFLPITYSALCYLAGLSRLPKRGFALICLIRIPRLIAYYYLVRLGWMAT